MNNIFFKTLFKKGAKGAKGEKGTSYEVPTNGIIGFDDEDGELDIPAGYDDATIPPYLIRKVIKTNGSYSAADEGAFGYSEVDVEIKNTPTLVSKTITENGTYDPADDNADGYLDVNVNVSGGGGGESIDGIYYDGTTDNRLRLPFYAQDYEVEVDFYIPSFQSNTNIFSVTAQNCPICFMITDNNVDCFRINNGSGGQIDYIPNSFNGDHTLILNRLNDRAIIFDEENLGTYGTNYFTNSPFEIGYNSYFGVYAAEFILKRFKLTDHSTGEIIADYKAGFRVLKDKYKIPCLFNEVNGTFLDLNTGKPSGNNNGHIMLCQKETRQLDPNYNYYTYDDEKIVVRVYHEGQEDEEIRWYFHNFSMPTGRQTFPTELARFYTAGANNQSAKSYTINTQNVNGWTILSDYLGGSINEYNTGYSRVESQAFDAMVIIGDGEEQDTVYTDPYVYL